MKCDEIHKSLFLEQIIINSGHEVRKLSINFNNSERGGKKNFFGRV